MLAECWRYYYLPPEADENAGINHVGGPDTVNIPMKVGQDMKIPTHFAAKTHQPS